MSSKLTFVSAPKTKEQTGALIARYNNLYDQIEKVRKDAEEEEEGLESEREDLLKQFREEHLLVDPKGCADEKLVVATKEACEKLAELEAQGKCKVSQDMVEDWFESYYEENVVSLDDMIDIIEVSYTKHINKNSNKRVKATRVIEELRRE